ncbi:helix-turn-helix transcriptional regulator [Paucibacter sp. DJ2R-2]|uniref:helix-turn-helix transcriptional regulator n=1 Tax=Paucibacter sp. DJ2R-2 TaxID=2893558 RepID=UPI0021E38B78|nr:YafY family protein [Paucibacter sp. DJ2R-2]MCV2438599.1 YafY family transcriptional regulator [Paucibacter sp. DJ2R-2]
MPSRAKKENTERIHKILSIVRHKNGATMQELMNELGVSQSTIKRDIAVLRDRIDCPIEFDRDIEKWVVHDLPGGKRFELPGLWFNASELYALLAMQHLVSGIQPGLLESHLHPLQQKLESLLGESLAAAKDVKKRVKLIHFAGRRIEVKNFELLTQAVLERKRVVMRYFNRDRNEETQREVSPVRLVHYRENWLLDAWCHLRNELRIFALDAIQEVDLTEKATFEVSQEELDGHFRSGYGIYAGKADKRAVLKFSKARARYVSLERWHSKQTSKWLTDGCYQLEVPYSKDQELVTDVLRFGADVEVLAPPELRQRVAELLRAAAELYS